MSFQPTPKQALVMWNLFITGDEPAISKVKPELKSAERQPLIEAGLIELVKRGRSSHIVLTDKAWEWASEHFDVELSISNFATHVLHRLLKKLGSYLKAKKIPLVEFLTFKDIETRIREAYVQVADPREIRVRLSKLRQYLSDLTRLEVDNALREMQLAGKISLIGMEDPYEIGLEDEEAAFILPGQDKRYFIYIER